MGQWPGLPCGTLGPHAALSLQMHYILQELVFGGMVLETSMNEIVAQVEAQSKLEKAEVSGSMWGLVPRCGYRAGWAPGALQEPVSCGQWGLPRCSQPACPQGGSAGWVLPIEGFREQPARGCCCAVKVNSTQ